MSERAKKIADQRRRWRLGMPIGIARSVRFGSDVQIGSGGSGEYITTLEENGLTDETDPADVRAAFAAAIADASANAGSSSTGRGVIELVQNKVYQCAATGNGTNVSNLATAILLDATTPNVEIRTQGKPTRASGNQAVLQAHDWSLYSGVTGRNILKLFNASNIKIGWLEIDGNKLSTGANATERRAFVSNAANGGIDGVIYPIGGNGAIFNISVMGGDGVTFKEVNSHSGLVDALYLRRFGDHNGTGTTLTGTTNALFEDCNFDRSRRVGLAHISAGRSSGTWDQVIFRRCTFNDCGDEAAMVGERPGWGVDIEPANPPQQSYGVTYEDCTFNGSQGGSNEEGEHLSQDNGRGFQIDTHAHLNYFKIIRPTINNNRSQGMRIGVRDGADCAHWIIEDLTCTGNGTNSINVDVPGSDTSSAGSQFTDFIFDNVDVPSIVFSSELPLTGHTIEVWQNGESHPPTVSFPEGFDEITINSGARS